MIFSGLHRSFIRPRTTVFLITILLALYLLGLLIPQKTFFSSREHYDAWQQKNPLLYPALDFIGFTDIYTSPITLFFVILFFLNLLAVLARRAPMVFRKALLTGREQAVSFTPEELQRSHKCRSIAVSGETAAAVLPGIGKLFRDRQWFVMQSQDGGRLLAVKNRLSALGFLLFHLSFLFCLIGGLMIYYTRFSGNIRLTEGQSFEGDIKQFYVVRREPKIMRALPALAFTVNKVDIDYEGEQTSRLDVSMKISYWGEDRDEHLKVNRPIRRGNVSILVMDAGVSPFFLLRSSEDGRILDGGWFSLDVLRGKEDSFSFPSDDRHRYSVHFFPDYVMENGLESSRSFAVRNPAFRIQAIREGDIIADATMRRGQAIVFEPFLLEFADLRYWADIFVVREIGPLPLVVGFALGVVGLMMRLIFYRREVRIARDGTFLHILGESEYYQHSFEAEMDHLEAEVKRIAEKGAS